MRQSTLAASVLVRSWPVLAVPSALLGLLIASTASAQMAGNTQRNIRPLVSISFQNPFPSGDPLALGIFDTGNDSISISPETNSRVGIGVAFTAPGANPELSNDAIVGKSTNITVGGYLGLAVGGPEINSTAAAPLNGPAHIFSTDTRRSSANPYSQTGFAPSLTYFGAIASANGLNNIGTAFVAGTATQNALVAEVDPTQAGFLPFALNDVTRAGLTPAFVPLNQSYSSVSFYASNSVQVPTATTNLDPGFLAVLPLTDSTAAVGASNFQQTLVPGPGAGNPGTTRGGMPMVAIGAGNPFGIAAANFGNYIPDTGAPTTGGPGGLLGTDNTNGFGQYWNFQASQLLLFAPTGAQDKAIVGPGILFNVDHTTVGLQGTGVNQSANYGITPVMNPGGAPTVLPSLAPEQSATIFRTQLTHSNAAYVSGIDAMNLSNQDQLLALSMGADTIPNPLGAAPGAKTNSILFAVDRNSKGLADDPTAFGGGVVKQTALGKQSANIYVSTTGNRLPVPGVNGVRFSGDLLGLGPNAGPAATAAAGGAQVDELRDFVVQSQNGYYNNGGNMTNVQRNIDPTITSPGDVRNPGGAITPSAVTPPATNPPIAARGDIYGSNFDTYFTLDKASPSRLAGGFSAADILVNNPSFAGPGFHGFAPAATLGLNPADQINTLALNRPFGSTQAIPLVQGFQNRSATVIPGTGFDPNIDGMFDNIDAWHGNFSDLALFTLDDTSPDLGIFDPVIGGFLSAADVFVTDFDGSFSLYDTAESLGLNPMTDEITGMKPLPLSAVPEPGSLALTGMAISCLVGWSGRRRRRPEIVHAAANAA